MYFGPNPWNHSKAHPYTAGHWSPNGGLGSRRGVDRRLPFGGLGTYGHLADLQVRKECPNGFPQEGPSCHMKHIEHLYIFVLTYPTISIVHASFRMWRDTSPQSDDCKEHARHSRQPGEITGSAGCTLAPLGRSPFASGGRSPAGTVAHPEQKHAVYWKGLTRVTARTHGDPARVRAAVES